MRRMEGSTPSAHGSQSMRRLGQIVGVTIVAASLLALLVMAYWSHLNVSSWHSTVTGFLDRADHWRTLPWAPLVALAAFAVGGLIAFPVSWMTAATIVVFGPWLGGAYAMVGAVLDAWVVYELGLLLPEETFDRWFGERGKNLRARIIGHGLIAMIVVRLLPIAPYSVISFIAGAARVGRFDYLAGSAIGMLHDVVLYGFFADRARAALLEPHPLTWLALGGAVLLVIVGAVVLHVWKVRADARRRGS